MGRLRKRAMLEALGENFTEKELRRALSGIDIIGDLAVVKLPREWEGRGHEIGELILSRLKHVKGVFRQVTPAGQGDRIRGLQWLAGKEETTTTYREHGCQFHLDIAKVYFSPRLSYERLRIASLVGHGEVLVNMFAGIGTFSIVIAKHSSAERIYSIDKSREAFGFMVENVAINKLNDKIIPLMGDAKDAVADLRGVADRVLMPLPELALEYLPYGLGCLGEQGWIHVYIHLEGSSREEAVSLAREAVRTEIKKLRRVSDVSGRIVRSIGRRKYQIVVDAKVGG